MTGSKTIGRAAVVVAVGVLLSRVLGYVRTLILAGLLGVGVDTDLYAAAFTIPDILFFLMAGGYLSITLVPLLAGHVQSGDSRRAGHVFTAVFRVVVGIMLLLTLALILAAGPITERVFPEITGDALDRLVSMVRVTFASQVFFIAGTLFMAAQYATRRFVVPTLAPLIYNLGIILGGVLGALVGDAAPEWFIWGGFVGAGIGNFAVQMWGAKRAGIWFTGGTRLWPSTVTEYFTLALPLMIGQSAVALDEMWPRLFGQFAGTGSISELYFARTLNMLPVGVIAQAAGVAAYPFLAGLAAEGKLGELRQTVARSVKGAITVGGLAAGLVVALAVPLVALAFQYGEFGPNDTQAVSGLLRIYAVTIPFWAGHQVYTRAFYAQRRMWTPVIIGTGVTLIVIPVLYVGVTQLGTSGVALGSTLGLVLYTLLIATAWHRGGPSSEGGAMIGVVVRVVAAATAAGAVAVGIAAMLSEAPPLVVTAISTVAGTLVYVAVGMLLGLDEITAFVQRTRRFLTRSSESS